MRWIDVWAKGSLSIIEAFVVLAVIGLILLVRRRPAPSFVRLERRFRQVARRKPLSIIGVGFLVVAVRILLIPVLGIPVPGTGDEFSYLLAADTFAHGHWTNPPHPMWVHFETFHVIQRPTYMSMYAPGQGVILAIGQLLGHPWIGILLVNALMCSALCWMLQAWIPPEWALLGAVLAALRLGLLSYWMNTYWGGALAATAGALVFGALPRIKRHPRVLDTVLMAAGIVILANSRPYEGLLFSLPVAAALFVWLASAKRPATGVIVRRVVAPMFVILLLGAVITGYYFYRVTGNPFQIPQLLNRATYSRARYFIWQAPTAELIYHHPTMQRFYNAEFQYFLKERTVGGFILHGAEKILLFWRFFLGPALSIPLLAFPWVLRDRRMRFPLMASAFFVFGIALEIWTAPHYCAPATAILYLLLLQSMRHLRRWHPSGKLVGAALVRAIPLVCCAMILLRISAILTHVQLELPWPRGDLARARIEQTLESQKGRQLILVRYSDTHLPDDEWVFNAADIDAAKVVWAHDMGKVENQELIDYYPDRNVWLVEPDQTPTKVLLLASARQSPNSGN